MGNAFSEAEEPMPAPLVEEMPMEEEIPAVEDTDIQQLQDASVAPITEEEAGLYTKTGKACCWTDSGEYAFRLRQLEIMNYAVKTLAEETWKDAEMINFQALHRQILTYKDVDGNEKDLHDWSLLSEDVTFKPIELPANRFKEFENYFQKKAGAAKKDQKEDFENFMTLFIRIRDGLMAIMAKGCSPQ